MVPATQPLLITRRQAAEMLSVHERTIENLQRRGELTLKKIGKAARCIRSEVEAIANASVAVGA